MAGRHRAVALKPHVLVVAGSDSSGGAGIARDIETVAALDVRACLAITAVTVQTHQTVEHTQPVAAALIAAQMRAAIAANPVAAIKIGMLGTAETVEAVSVVLAACPDIPVVLDPVLAATSGRSLLDDDAVEALRGDLMPRCLLVTPNLIELAKLTGSTVALDEAIAVAQGEALSRSIGGTAVLVKGGHAQGASAVDLLAQADRPTIRFAAPRLKGTMRGTGCMLSSAIAAFLAKSSDLEASIRHAKAFVFRNISDAG